MDVKAEILTRTMDSVLLDLERARMTAEDFRQGNGPCSAVEGLETSNLMTKQALLNLSAQSDVLDGDLRHAQKALMNIRVHLCIIHCMPKTKKRKLQQIEAEVNSVLDSDRESDEEWV